MADQAHYNMRGTASHSRSIGITHRATPLAFAWTGEQRVRFSDFQVNEIRKDGSVVHLRNVGLNDEPKQPSQETPDQPSAEAQPKTEAPNNAQADEPAQEEQKTEIPPSDVAILASLAGEKFAQELVQLFHGEQGADGEKITSVMSGPLDDKSKRGQIHGEVRRIFKSGIETSTGDSGAIVATKVSLSRKGKKRSRGARGRGDDKPTGEYLHFTLYKDNRDTMDAVNQVARVLRTKPQSIGYAGTKDRRASTAQRCSVRYTRARALAGANGKLWGIATGDYEYRDDHIHLGQLLGNEFVITLKNCNLVGESTEQPVSERLEAMKAQVQSALDHMATHGWINYFGHQRFGTHQIGTHQIGKLILGDKWEEAVMALLTYDPDIAAKAADGEVPTESMKRDEYARHHACMLFKTGKDIAKAAKIMPGRFTAEACILRHLTRLGNGSMKDFPGAVTHITRGLRSMYLHAYQSHVWNHVASRRWELHGEKVIKGDLVIAEGEAFPLVSGQDQDGDDIVNPVEEGDDDAVHARPLTEEEASSGRYTIHDVVLPSPGYDVVYPDNEIGAFYDEFMGREDNGGLDPNKMRRLRREFSLPGRYRKLMNRFLAEPSIEFRLYTDDTEQMHPTDLDLIEAARGSGGNGNGNGKRRRDAAEDEGASKKAKVDADAGEKGGEDAETGEGNGSASTTDAAPAAAPTKIAAIVRFQLGSSAYATVALRELMGDMPDETANGKPNEEKSDAKAAT
ncbi:Multisubstrate pseudouridine synthase 7 [Tolypocladium paradoxum]|uniref:Multisubstrate pseudouridine synthase 7 n=1 Tax=Tolypocladium paradoxum TaxID=94208 RepID=A0A2S4KVB4_9HYPO|nr:Multisubstrate pseudouridine synthase 7 [Tolypocladium paradoxum]